MAGTRETCGICGAVIETPAKDLELDGKRIAGALIDLRESRANLEAHYAAKHPGVTVPEGPLW